MLMSRAHFTQAVLVLELIDLAQRLDQALLEHVGGQVGVVQPPAREGSQRAEVLDEALEEMRPAERRRLQRGAPAGRCDRGDPNAAPTPPRETRAP